MSEVSRKPGVCKSEMPVKTGNLSCKIHKSDVTCPSCCNSHVFRNNSQGKQKLLDMHFNETSVL